MAVHGTDFREQAPERTANDRATPVALLAFAGACLAVAGIFLAFPALWDGLLAASQTIYESRVVSAILCRP